MRYLLHKADDVWALCYNPMHTRELSDLYLSGNETSMPGRWYKDTLGVMGIGGAARFNVIARNYASIVTRDGSYMDPTCALFENARSCALGYLFRDNMKEEYRDPDHVRIVDSLVSQAQTGEPAPLCMCSGRPRNYFNKNVSDGQGTSFLDHFANLRSCDVSIQINQCELTVNTQGNLDFNNNDVRQNCGGIAGVVIDQPSADTSAPVTPATGSATADLVVGDDVSPLPLSQNEPTTLPPPAAPTKAPAPPSTPTPSEPSQDNAIYIISGILTILIIVGGIYLARPKRNTPKQSTTKVTQPAK